MFLAQMVQPDDTRISQKIEFTSLLGGRGGGGGVKSLSRAGHGMKDSFLEAQTFHFDSESIVTQFISLDT